MAETRKKLGTFDGVFTPSILTILGVIMFLRANYVTGQAGISGALGILLIAEAIVLITALSIAAIATNTPVKGGGAYFLISRTMGPEFGGAIGLALYLAQAVSVPLYLLGFAQAVTSSFPSLVPWLQVIAVVTTVAVFIINYVGVHWAIKAQYIVMAMLALAIVSFLGGAAMQFDSTRFAANWLPAYTTPKLNFWVMMAIYFPAVTGILAGVNMSGDLRDPARSLVRGTLAAIGAGFVIYAVEILLFGGAVTRQSLVDEPYESMMITALWGSAFLVIGGVFAATLSSGIGSMMGAPRILQALAADRIIPGLSFFSAGQGPNHEPRRALWLTGILSLAVIIPATGDNARSAFDLVAELTTMFFLCTYGMINLAAFVESFGSNPSFRPSFRFFHWSASLLGAIACVLLMFMINVAAATLAVICIAVISYAISRRVMASTFGDARRGFLYATVSRSLQQLARFKTDPRNWRPSFLALSSNPAHHEPLARHASWLGAGSGLVTLAHVLNGRFDQQQDERNRLLTGMQAAIHTRHPNVFPEVVVATNEDDGLLTVMQAHSIGPIKPNTVLLGWPPREERAPALGGILRAASALNLSALCLVNHEPDPQPAERRIDVWWRGKANGSLMLILAHLLTRNAPWQDARIRILRTVSNPSLKPLAVREMDQLVTRGRIQADILVPVSDRPFAETLRQHSHHAAIIFMGFETPTPDRDVTFHQSITNLLTGMPVTLLIHSSGEADLLA